MQPFFYWLRVSLLFLHWPISSGLSHCFQAQSCIKNWWSEEREFTSYFFKLYETGHGRIREIMEMTEKEDHDLYRGGFCFRLSTEVYRFLTAKGEVMMKDSQILILLFHCFSPWLQTPQVAWSPCTLKSLHAVEIYGPACSGKNFLGIRYY